MKYYLGEKINLFNISFFSIIHIYSRTVSLKISMEILEYIKNLFNLHGA